MTLETETVADLIGYSDEPVETLATGDLPEPGVYFDMDEEMYHAAPALSNSGIKHLLVSPMDFWARSWLNPNREDEQSDAMTLGKAYHKRILEGREAFYRQYVAEIDPNDYPDALRTADHLKAFLEQHDAKKAGKKADLIDRVLDIDPTAMIWDVLVEDHKAKHEGKEFLSAAAVEKIELSASMIEKHPTLKKAFTGGFPEVSIFWVDEFGIPMKARLDYLKARAIVDLKTFANQQAKPIDRAVAYDMAARKYHLQVAVYTEAVRAAQAMIRQRGMSAVHGLDDEVWVKRFMQASSHDFVFVYQQTGIAPVARGYRFPLALAYEAGQATVRMAKQQFRDCFEAFGSDPWVDDADLVALADEDFPVFMTAD